MIGRVPERTGQITVAKSTINANDAEGDDGGGILFSPGAGDVLNVTNSTLSGNEATTEGGAIWTDQGTTNLANATLNRNTADSDNEMNGDGGGIKRTGAATVNLKNTLMAGNRDVGGNRHDCDGTLNSQGYNLIGQTNPACTIGGVTTGNQVGSLATPIDPKLAFLAGNSGSTLTHALLSGSPALNGGYPGSGLGQPCEATDQRGLPRGGGAGGCDIGAFEVQGPPSVATPASATPPTATPPSSTKKKCKKRQKLKKGKCVKKKKKK